MSATFMPSMLEGSTSAVDMGRWSLPPAALLGLRGDLLAHRPLEGRSGPALLRLAVGRGRQGPRPGPSALLSARHRPVDGTATARCRPTACLTPTRTRKLQEDLGPDPCLRHRAQGLGQAVLGFGRQHQVGPDGERRVDRPDLGRPAARPSRRKASPSTTGAEGRRDRLARRPLADQGRQEHRSGLCVPRTTCTRRRRRPRSPKARATTRSSPAPMRCSPTRPRRTSRKPIPGDALEEPLARPAEPAWYRRPPRPIRRQVQVGLSLDFKH